MAVGVRRRPVTVYLVAAGGAATSRPRACSAPTSAGAGARRVGALPALRARLPSELPRASAAPGRRADRRLDRRAGEDPARAAQAAVGCARRPRRAPRPAHPPRRQRRGEAIDGTCTEISDQPLLEAARADREAMLEARPDRQAHLADEICRLERGSTRCSSAARRIRPTAGCWGISPTSASTCSRSSRPPGSPRPTGAPNRRSAPLSSTANTGAATAPGTARTPNRC